MTPKPKTRRFALVPAIVASIACSGEKSENPLGPDVAGPIPGVVISAPATVEPPVGAQFTPSNEQQTLVIQNATTTGQRPLWMELDVASDATFQSMVHQDAKVNPDPSGRTSYRLPAALSAGKTYYWRARALDGANTGPYSAVAHFSIAAPVVIGAPTAVAPAGNIATNRPEFRATNGAVSGPAGSLIIRFEVANAPDPAAIVAVVSTTPGAGGTTTMSLGELPWNQTFYWRTYATDGTHTSPFSSVLTFKTPAPPSVGPPPPGPPLPGPPPPPPPPGGGGGPVGPARTISPNEALQIVRTIHDTERWNLGSGTTREHRIGFLFRAVATIHYGHSRYNPAGPDSKWCVKDAGGGRPPSDDVIVRCDTRDAYDLVGSSGADGYSFHLDSIGRLPAEQNVYPPPRSALPQ
jgi:hypothetical protein